LSAAEIGASSAMDKVGGESMEPMEEVPLKELGETESVGCPEAYLMTQIAYSESRGGSYECCL